MKKFVQIEVALYIIAVVEVVIFLFLAPNVIVTQYSENVTYGSKYTLLLYPILLIVIGYVMFQATKRYRKQNALEQLLLMTTAEWQMLAALVVIQIVFTILMLFQIGILS